MRSVHDVAAYILSRTGAVSAMKLQKLVYYAQAWRLARTGHVLFLEKVRAFAYGPVVYELYQTHRRQFVVSSLERGCAEALTADEQAHVDWVLGRYGSLSAEQLSDMTHQESPWVQAREGAPTGSRGFVEITPESMRAYYVQAAQAA